MNKQDFCKKYGLTEHQFLGTEKITGSLYLRSLTSIPEGFNPTVGGSIDLRSLTSIPEGFNPTVGGSLYLEGGLKSNYRQQNGPIFWDKYVLADGMFTKILSKKGNIYKVKKIEDPKEFYLIIDGIVSAHGDTIKKAKEDLDYKVKSESLKNNPVLPDEIITIQRYRAITGACEAGVKAWMQQNNASEMPANDLLPILEKTNAYGYQKFLKLINF